MEPEIGQLYSVTDTLGMVANPCKYIGRGKLFIENSAGYSPDSKEYYVFEAVEKGYYKYCIAHPVFSGLKWAGYFQATTYSNSLKELLSYPKTRFELI